ncbi:MAG: hypothetical protein SGJ19_27720 [Planctomycetia bacterium]|nr:hypothetical protein [Planctomycetia bacterium]
MPQDLMETEQALTELATAYQFSLTVFRRHMYLCPGEFDEEGMKELTDALRRWAQAQEFTVKDAQKRLLRTGIEVPDRWLLNAVPTIRFGEGKSPHGHESTRWCFVQGVDVHSLNTAVRELRQSATRVSAGATLPPALTSPTSNNLAPVARLFGWPSILDAVKQPNENKELVRKLNSEFEGPIKLGGRGSRPSVVKQGLVQWWNTLESRMAELDAKKQNKGATLSAQYKHGRDGEVMAPEIRGSVKKGRRKR